MKARLRSLLLTALLAAALPAARAAAVTNTWVRKTGGDPKVSTAANWSLGHPPRADEVAVFSPRHPTAAIWDAAAPQEIGGLVLSGGYISVLTVETSREGPLRALRVKGDVVVEGGALTHPQNADADVWWLNLSVDGAFRVGPDGIVSVSGKGHAPGKGPSPGNEPGWGASHGGQGAPRALAEVSRPPLTCDSILDPDQSGSGGTVRDGAPATVGHGGGDAYIMKELFHTMTTGEEPKCSGSEGLESAVLARVFGKKLRYQSTKALTGHTLGAAGTIEAAKFLERFVPEGMPWGHLDIAGTAWWEAEKAWSAPGATLAMARTLAEWAETTKAG